MKVFSVSCVSSIAPAVEQDLRLAVGLVVAVLVGNEQQVRGRADPHAAEADFQAADEVQPFDEDGPLVERAVAVGVFEDQDAVAAFVPPARGCG